ncbi:hypothetical protein CYMTET_46377, partial [Cymbomonas tetramitiformis]
SYKQVAIEGLPDAGYEESCISFTDVDGKTLLLASEIWDVQARRIVGQMPDGFSNRFSLLTHNALAVGSSSVTIYRLSSTGDKKLLASFPLPRGESVKCLSSSAASSQLLAVSATHCFLLEVAGLDGPEDSGVSVSVIKEVEIAVCCKKVVLYPPSALRTIEIVKAELSKRGLSPRGARKELEARLAQAPDAVDGKVPLEFPLLPKADYRGAVGHALLWHCAERGPMAILGSAAAGRIVIVNLSEASVDRVEEAHGASGGFASVNGLQLWIPPEGCAQAGGAFVVSAGQDNTVSITDLNSKASERRPRVTWHASHKWACHSLAVYAKENVCVTGSNCDKYIKVWSLLDGSLIKRVGPMGEEMRKGKFSVMCLAFASDGTIAVTNSNDADDDVLHLVTRK